MSFEKQMDNLLDSMMLQYNIPGFDCAIYYKHKPFYRHSNGFASVEKQIPITKSTLYNGYSITKLVTCTAALQLVEKGRMHLGDSVFKYLPEFSHMQVLQKDGSVGPAKNIMKIKDLFCMTAGFNYDISAPAIQKFIKETDGKCPTDLLPKYLSEAPLDFEPSSAWRYSLCHDLLAVVVSRVAEMPFSAYVKKYIFDPLGMKDSSFFITDANRDRMADVYWNKKDTGERPNVGIENSYRFGSEYESGGAGIVTSVDDYILFADALCKGDVLLKKDTTRLMYQDHLTPEQFSYYKIHQPKGFSYGLGVRTIVDQALAETTVGFGDFGWGGAAGAFITMHMDKEITVVYLQHMLSTPVMLRHYIRNKVYELLA